MRTLGFFFGILLLLTVAPLPTAAASCSTTSLGGQVVRVTATTGSDTSCLDVTAYRCVLRIDPSTGQTFWVCSAIASTPPVPDAGVDCTSRTVGGVPVKVTLSAGSDPACAHATVYRCTFYYDVATGQIEESCARVIGV